MKRSVVVLVIGLAPLLVACASTGSGSAMTSVREIVMLEMSYAPNRIDARVGERVTISLVNKGNQARSPVPGQPLVYAQQQRDDRPAWGVADPQHPLR
jgi:hypothetical protein